MQKLFDKFFPNLSPEEQWVELLALLAVPIIAFFFACIGFMIGPIFTGKVNNLSEPGIGHYSFECAGVGALLGLVVGGIMTVVRRILKKAEPTQEEAHH